MSENNGQKVSGVGREKEEMVGVETSFYYKGVEIRGINYLEENGILGRKDVVDFLDQLPAGYFRLVPLGVIDFCPYELFSIEREGEIIYVRKEDLSPRDRVIARKRGVTSWNRRMEGGIAVPTDGKMTIKIFSPLNWDGKKNQQLDKDTALFSLAHEIGHTIWQTIVYGPGIFNELERLGIPLPCSGKISEFFPFIEEWKNLPRSQLPRYLEYEPVFSQEHKRDSAGFLDVFLEDLSKQEDFAIAHEYFLYWKNLNDLDEIRNRLLQKIWEQLSELVEF